MKNILFTRKFVLAAKVCRLLARMEVFMDIQSLCTDEDIVNVIEKYKKMVYSLAITRVRNQYDADDVFQEVFLVYIRKQPHFNEEEHRKAWLINTTINCSKKIFSKSWGRKSVSLESISENIFYFSSEEDNLIYNALCELPEKYRTVLHLFYFEDMAVKEISFALRKKEGTIRMQLKRGREMLHEKLKGDYFNE